MKTKTKTKEKEMEKKTTIRVFYDDSPNQAIDKLAPALAEHGIALHWEDYPEHMQLTLTARTPAKVADPFDITDMD